MNEVKGITVVTERGQVSIPAPLRRELGLAKGKRLLWEVVGPRQLRITLLEDGRPAGAEAMRGFARRFRPEPRATAEWMGELREGES